MVTQWSEMPEYYQYFNFTYIIYLSNRILGAISVNGMSSQPEELINYSIQIENEGISTSLLEQPHKKWKKIFSFPFENEETSRLSNTHMQKLVLLEQLQVLWVEKETCLQAGCILLKTLKAYFFTFVKYCKQVIIWYKCCNFLNTIHIIIFIKPFKLKYNTIPILCQHHARGHSLVFMQYHYHWNLFVEVQSPHHLSNLNLT